MSDIKLLGPDGKLTPVAPNQVQHALENGYQALKGSTLPLKDEHGTVRFVPAESGLQGLKKGWTVASKDEASLASAQETYTAPVAAAVGFAKGVPAGFGVSTERVAGTYAEYSKDFQQRVDPFEGPVVSTPKGRVLGTFTGAARGSPIAALGGEIAGFAAPALLTGGGLAAGAEGALAEAGAGKVLSRFGGFAAEGALGGLAAEDSEAALRNESLTAERAVAGATFGALLSGGAGVGLMGLEHAGANVLSRLRGGAPRVASSLERVAAEELATKEATGFGRTLEDRAIRQADFDDAKISARIQKEVYENMTGLHEGGFDVTKESYGPGKSANVRKMVGDQVSPGVADRVTSTRASGLKYAEDIVEEKIAAKLELDEANEALRAQKRKFKNASPGSSPTASFEARVERARGRASAAQHPLMDDFEAAVRESSGWKHATDAESFEAANGAKDLFTKLSDRAKELKKGASYGDGKMLDSAAKHFGESAQSMRGLTQSEELFGKVGRAEREIAAARSAQIAAEETAFPILGQQIQEPSGRMVWKWDPEKVSSMLRDARNMDNPGVREFQKWLQATHDLHGKITEHYGVKAAETVALQSKAARIGAAFEEAQIHAGRLAKLEEVGFRSRTGSLGNRGIAASLVDDGARLGMMAQAERQAMKVAKATGIAVDEFFVAGGKGKAPKTVPFLKGPGGERATFERTVDAVLEAQANPAKVAELAGNAIPSDRAGVGFHISQTMMRGLGYLAAHIPPGFAADPELVAPHLHKPLYSDQEMRVWARRAAAIHSPLTVLEHLAQGIVVAEEVDALREVYPDMYAQLDLALRTGLANPATPPLTRQQKLQLSVLFGQAVDPNLSTRVFRNLQMPADGRAGKAKPGVVSLKGKGLKSVDLGSSISDQALTDVERLAKR
jgi:hypothetical protein